MKPAVGLGVVGLCVGVILPFFAGFRATSSELQPLQCFLWLICKPLSSPLFNLSLIYHFIASKGQ
jgi:hypothetical protein